MKAIEGVGMCCRYYIGETVDMEMIVAEMMKSPLVSEWQKKYAVVSEGEVRPTDIAPVIATSIEDAELTVTNTYINPVTGNLIVSKSNFHIGKESF